MSLTFIGFTRTTGGSEPAGVLPGDLLISADSTTSATPPASWTALSVTGSNNNSLVNYAKIIRGSSAPSYAWSSGIVYVWAFRGSFTFSGITVQVTTTGAGGGTSLASATVSGQTTSDAEITYLKGSTAGSVSTPANWTADRNVGSGDAAFHALAADVGLSPYTWTFASTAMDLYLLNIPAQSAVTKTATFDAVLAQRQSLTATLDAVFATTVNKTATFDAAFANPTLKTALLDAVLASRALKTATFDADFMKTQTVTALFDAVMALRQNKLATFDAILAQHPILTAVFDAVFASVATKTATFDGYFATLVSKTATFDGELVGQVVKTATFDALLGYPKEPPPGTATLVNAPPRGTVTLTHLGPGTVASPKLPPGSAVLQ